MGENAVCRTTSNLGGVLGTLPGPSIGPARLNLGYFRINLVGTLRGCCDMQTHPGGLSRVQYIWTNCASTQYSTQKGYCTVWHVPHSCGCTYAVHEYDPQLWACPVCIILGILEPASRAPKGSPGVSSKN